MRILLVDDERLILYSLSKSFRLAGAEVTEVMNGRDALAELQRGSYDICFLDVQLPDSNGLELMKIIRDLSPSTEIIIMTASDLTGKQLLSMKEQGCLYLSKPFNLDEAQELVSRHQRRSAAPEH